MIFGAKHLYWIAQIIGWSSYVILASLFSIVLNKELGFPELIALLYVWLLGLFLSHIFRYVILHFYWLNLKIASIIPRLIVGAIASSLAFEALYVFGIFALTSNKSIFSSSEIIQDLLSWSLLFLFWSLIYFFYHFFKNYKQEEIKNLQLQAAHNEFQINRLRSQLNPHFIFNAMNSIRSLVDENPKKAKKAITQLSNVLRNSLLMDKKMLISMEDEIALVNDYLEIEKARFEDRLDVIWDIKKHNEQRLIPPLMLQTLVENAIKHGISKLPSGGKVKISLNCVANGCDIKVSNTGKLGKQSKAVTGYGISSSRKRLELLYDKNAHLDLYEKDDMVVAEVFIPKDSKFNKT